MDPRYEMYKIGDIVKFQKGHGKIEDTMEITRITNIDGDISFTVKVVVSVSHPVDRTFPIGRNSINLLNLIKTPSNFKKDRVKFRYVRNI